jgi:site-specific DNA-methyltransferase (adenine-specific)
MPPKRKSPDTPVTDMDTEGSQAGRKKLVKSYEMGVAGDAVFTMPDYTPAPKKRQIKAPVVIEGDAEHIPQGHHIGQSWKKYKPIHDAKVSAAGADADAAKKNNMLGPFALDNYYIMDALEALKQIPDASVDHIVTSPPYNLAGLARSHGRNLPSATTCGTGWFHRVGYHNTEGFEDCVPEMEYQQQQIDILNELARIVKPVTGSIFYNHKNRRCFFRDFSPLEWICKSKLNLYQECIWDRRTSLNAYPDKFLESTERLYWLTPTRTGPRFFRDRLPNEFKTHVWSIPVRKETEHPASMPLQIPFNSILSTTEPGDVVLDMYAGSGTSLLAAAKLGRHFIGFDISPTYETMFWGRMQKLVEDGHVPQSILSTVIPRLQARQVA